MSYTSLNIRRTSNLTPNVHFMEFVASDMCTKCSNWGKIVEIQRVNIECYDAEVNHHSQNINVDYKLVSLLQGVHTDGYFF
jgi:hypothetical protein